jgi:hypothetical protein
VIGWFLWTISFLPPSLDSFLQRSQIYEKYMVCSLYRIVPGTSGF